MMPGMKPIVGPQGLEFLGQNLNNKNYVDLAN